MRGHNTLVRSLLNYRTYTIISVILKQIEATTDYFPFKISENKCGHAITLTRALKDEQIKVVVSMPSFDDDDDDEKKNESSSPSSYENAIEEEEEKEEEEDEEEKEGGGGGEKDTSNSTMHLEVTISKADGSNLQFTCFADPDKIEIDTMYMAQATTKEDGDADHDMATYDGFE